LTRVDIGHTRIGSAGNGRRRSRGSGWSDQRHAIMNFGDQLVGISGDHRKGADPLACSRVLPVLPQPAYARIRIADDPKYLTVGQVKRRFGDVSDMWIWRAMQPVRFGGPTSARHWLISDIEQWVRIALAQVRP
jgi:hypothetical protein